MNDRKFDDTLIKILEKQVIKERWKNKFRMRGKVIDKKITRKGGYMFTVETAKSEYGAIVPKHRKIGFELAKNINVGDLIKVVGDRKIDVIFCDRIQKLDKGILKGKQMKLIINE